MSCRLNYWSVQIWKCVLCWHLGSAAWQGMCWHGSKSYDTVWNACECILCVFEIYHFGECTVHTSYNDVRTESHLHSSVAEATGMEVKCMERVEDMKYKVVPNTYSNALLKYECLCVNVCLCAVILHSLWVAVWISEAVKSENVLCADNWAVRLGREAADM